MKKLLMIIPLLLLCQSCEIYFGITKHQRQPIIEMEVSEKKDIANLANENRPSLDEIWQKCKKK